METDGDDIQGCPTELQQRNATLKTHTGHCYEFEVRHTKDWNAAQKDCHSKGGTLVTVNDRAEQDFLMSALKAISFHGTGIWLGYNDMTHEGTFTWVTGYPFLNPTYENIYKTQNVKESVYKSNKSNNHYFQLI